MRASLDTNAIIHFYRAGVQDLLFDLFDEGVIIHEFIRNTELEHHGQDILPVVDADISSGRIIAFNDDKLKEMDALSLFRSKFADNRPLYNPGDLGEVYAISLAETFGCYSLVTDDIKNGGPYKSLLEFYYSGVIPLNFADILLLLFIKGSISAKELREYFKRINELSAMNWSFRAKIREFVKRFRIDPYHEEEKEWLEEYCIQHGTTLMDKIKKI